MKEPADSLNSSPIPRRTKAYKFTFGLRSAESAGREHAWCRAPPQA